MPTVTAIDAENGVITLGTDRVDAAAYSFRNLCARAAELQQQMVDPEQYWERVGNAEMQMARLQDSRASSAIRVSGSGAAPLLSEDNDVFESRLRSFVCRPFAPVYNGVFSVPAEPEPPRQLSGCGCVNCTKIGETLEKSWVKFWSNLGVAHTAAVFILEVHWDDKEHRFSNEKVIRSYIGAETSGD